MGQRDYGEITEYINNYKENHSKSLPWKDVYHRILSRCNGYSRRDKANYSDRGFKCHVKPRELREIFFRDRAWKMKQPSIDRIDPDKGYFAKNLRFIEFEENRKMRGLNHPKYKKKAEDIVLKIKGLIKKTSWSNRLQGSLVRKLAKEFLRENAM